MVLARVLVTLIGLLARVLDRKGVDFSLSVYRDGSFVDKILSMQFQALLNNAEVIKKQADLLDELEPKLFYTSHENGEYDLIKYYDYLDFLQKHSSVQDSIMLLKKENQELWDKYVIFNESRKKGK